jgi:hypothetical protein
MARPTKRTPERQTAILNSLRLGNTRRAAAAFAEIDPATMWRWCEDDATFRNAVEKAEADAETRFLGNIAKAAADGTWTAAAWWLERRRHEDYRKREGVELTGLDGGPIETADRTGTLSDADLRDALRAAAALTARTGGTSAAEGEAEG